MKLFSRNKHKNEKQKVSEEIIDVKKIDYTEIDTQIDENEVNPVQKEERIRYIESICEQISETRKLNEDCKVEYGQVTSYLTDIQTIEQVPKEEKEVLLHAATHIYKLSNERDKLKRRTLSITDNQYKLMEPYESSMPDEIKKIKDQESYQLIVKNDIRQLNGEKAALHYEKREIILKQNFLKKISVAVAFIVVSLFAMFTAIRYTMKEDITIPYIVTVVFAALMAFYIFIEASKNRKNMVTTEKRQNRAILLLNKVKIKYVNCTNSLDYLYEKYNVKNSIELEFLWGEYLKLKEEWERQNRTTKLLNEYNSMLVKELEKFHVKDPDIWFYQASAIVNKKEMDEVERRLDIRRKKLKDKMDYNHQIIEKSQNELGSIKIKWPEISDELLGIVRKYQL